MNREIDSFISYLNSNNKIFAPAISQNFTSRPEAFAEIGELLLKWAKNYLGSEYLKILATGYCSFVIDVNKSQLRYEKDKRYLRKNYQEVFDAVYDNVPHMNLYHWGVYVTLFAWQHHLDIFTFFKNYFLPVLGPTGKALDLGSGSGVWSMLLGTRKPDWSVFGIDISEQSVALSGKMAQINGISNVCFKVGDALSLKNSEKFDAGISCLLLEHLEVPARLLESLATNIIPGGYAFITGALTAAEVDHIHEFKNESELVNMSESHGFRVIAALSSGPQSHNRNSHFLPRTMALVLQKKINDIW